MFKILNPSNTISLVTKTISILTFLFLIFIAIGLVQSLLISPIDYIQGHSVRIMYVHVPSSWISIACLSIIGFLSVLSFIYKNKNFSLLGKSLAPLGLMFAVISIVTGALWGQPTWGTWWAWDARLTSMLVLVIFYVAYILSWKLVADLSRSCKISSIIAIAGLFNLPIIKYSVDWWSTLHQSSSIKIISNTTIHYSMLFPLMIMFFALLIYSALIFLMKYKTEIIKLKNKGLDRL